MSLNYNNIFVIHLTRFNTVEEFEKVLKFNGIEGSIDSTKLMELKNNGYLKVFFDIKTFDPIAFTHDSDKKKVHFQDEYLAFMKAMPSLSHESEKNTFDMDTILEKISVSGIGSLSKAEKEFLDNIK